MVLAIKSKIGIGLLFSYASFELYTQIRTSFIISNRKKQVKLIKNGDAEIDITRFKSATVAGMFINPFSEYRPQTIFEFIFVRILELAESLYGSNIEIHDKLPKPLDGAVEVEDMLKTHKPALEVLKHNSQLFQSCVEKNDFSRINHGILNSQFTFKSDVPPLPSLASSLIFSWLGQSCCFFQLSGINFLTDPILSDHLVSENFGPKRLNKSPMSFEDIQYASNNNLNFILVSHDHPDHLEMNLIKKIGNSSTWIVPLGLKQKLARRGVYKVIELDWWDSASLNEYISPNLPDNYSIECVPAMHWSGRYVLDSNKSLWCSFIIKKNGESILYHAGDTGYSKDLFDVIGKKFGPILLSLLPIGQYCPSWHQKPRHISPQESVDIFTQTNSSFMKGVHWGTFKLSSEPILEPKKLLNDIAKRMDKVNHIKTPDFGLSYLYDLKKGTEVELHV